MSIDQQLNQKQLEAVTCIDSHLRIIAGAGSGKTRVVTTRIAYLIDEMNVLPNRILAITFTNKAAKEMKDRVESMLDERAGALRISTIHSFCVRVLREDILELKYPRNFQILDGDDQKSILREAYKHLDIDVKMYSYASMLSYISNNKTNFIDSIEALKNAHAKYYDKEIKQAQVYAYYENRLKEMYALDFDDLQLFTYRLFKERKDIREKWQRRFDYIHVDEFQDVDFLQYNLVRMLMKKDSYLCVVGDPDQTIYTWRGADVSIILQFEKDFPNCKTVILNENYRSTPEILGAANAVIAHNKHRLKKDLFTENTNGHRIIHFSAQDDSNESLWVASKILSMSKGDVDYKDIAILYRSNYLSRGLEKALRDFHIPYRIFGGVRFYDRKEIKDALSYLRLLLEPSKQDPLAKWKDLAIRRIINVPKRGIGTKTMERLEDEAISTRKNLYEVIKADQVASGKARSKLKEFVELIEYSKKRKEVLAIDKLLEELLQESGYIKMLEDDKEVERLENIQELIQDISDYVENDPEASLEEYLQDISLYTDIENNMDENVVQLMTIHAAKGLEFDHVFVFGMSESVFPSERSIIESGNHGLEEERRLAYVAMTRARKQLYLSDSHGYSYVLDGEKKTSRFIKEIPEECLQKVGAASPTMSSSSNTMSSRLHPRNESEESNQPRKSRGTHIRKGDLVHHQSFGDGVVIKLEGNLATIAFDARYGIRKILATHPSLTKK